MRRTLPWVSKRCKLCLACVNASAIPHITSHRTFGPAHPLPRARSGLKVQSCLHSCACCHKQGHYPTSPCTQASDMVKHDNKRRGQCLTANAGHSVFVGERSCSQEQSMAAISQRAGEAQEPKQACSYTPQPCSAVPHKYESCTCTWITLWATQRAPSTKPTQHAPAPLPWG